MDNGFNGFCVLCSTKDLCFENSICMRRCLTNEFDDDANVADDEGLNELTELTKESTYFIHENNAHINKG